MKKIEILFPEVANLYGELANMRYLKNSSKEIELVETSLNDVPLFVNERPDLIYMGTMNERNQVVAIDRLSKYKEEIIKAIDEGVNFLITGNAIEVFGEVIEDADGTVVKGLGILEIKSKRNMNKRFNSLFLGQFSDMDIAGFKCQFGHSYYNEGTKQEPFLIAERGPGLYPDIKEEGIKINNFMATYLIGPIVILNPPLAKYILDKMGIEDKSLYFEEETIDAYETRIAEYRDPNTGIYYH